MRRTPRKFIADVSNQLLEELDEGPSQVKALSLMVHRVLPQAARTRAAEPSSLRVRPRERVPKAEEGDGVLSSLFFGM